MTTPLFSIIIPHRDIPSLLQRCLASIPVRDYLQVIVVDDNSCDDVLTALYDLQHRYPHVQFVYDKEARGPGRARNIGQSLARGKWLVFADADDFFEEGFWDKAPKLMENQKADLIYFKVRGVWLDTLEPCQRGEDYNHMVDKYMHGVKYAEEQLRLSHVTPWGKIIRHSMVKDNHITFEVIPVGEDTMYSTYVALNARTVAACDTVMYVAVARRGSLGDTHNVEYDRSRYLVNLRRHKAVKSFYTDSYLSSIKCGFQQSVGEGLWRVRQLFVYRINPIPSMFRWLSFAVEYVIDKYVRKIER